MSQVRILSPRPLIYNGFPPPRGRNAELDPSNPQDYNRYSYVRNNPLSYVDPSGFASQCLSVYTPGEGEVFENPDGSFEDDIPSMGFYSDICFDTPDINPPTTPGGPPGDATPGHTAFPPGSGRGPENRPPAAPVAPPQRVNQPQGNPSQHNCQAPGMWARIGSALSNWGSQTAAVGTTFAGYGANLALASATVGLVAPITAPVTGPLTAAGLAAAAVGGGVSR
jgi:hypothetical protein